MSEELMQFMAAFGCVFGISATINVMFLNNKIKRMQFIVELMAEERKGIIQYLDKVAEKHNILVRSIHGDTGNNSAELSDSQEVESEFSRRN